jgi:hypothetical protein
MDKTEQHKRAMLDALEKSLGVVTAACKAVGIGRTTHYLWMQEDAEYKAAVDGLSDVALDFAESQLHKQIKDGNSTATIFFLKTKGKKRGYIERQEVEVASGQMFQIEVLGEDSDQ